MLAKSKYSNLISNWESQKIKGMNFKYVENGHLKLSF